ncbi:PREDICTED: FBD-associated F-box protein At4g13985-like [Camelina sativa]|uniref:FBD-associated F-box protein At4g13985-like n=1 Tax=Camelina sativa TaxID=90675 RepID=A0ABM0V6D1_CAMSA|nr:PREDICTED: FBD-associated F-box protein At4g13985-like [Camelina sativa]
MDDEDGERRVRAKRSGDKVEEVDRLRNLPDCLLNEILLKLPTKDVIKWRYVPGLDFECRDFMTSEFHDPSEFITMLGFAYRYLGFNSEPCLQKFKLTVNLYEGVFLDTAHFTHWMNAVFERKFQHLHILDRFWGMDGVEFCTLPEEEGVGILPGPRRFLTSLEYVKIVKPDSEEEEEEATEIDLELVSYFLENSAILKKLTLCLGYLRRREESVILRKLLTIPRLSTSCQVFVL